MRHPEDSKINMDSEVDIDFWKGYNIPLWNCGKFYRGGLHNA
jgi:hypothetical protein